MPPLINRFESSSTTCQCAYVHTESGTPLAPEHVQRLALDSRAMSECGLVFARTDSLTFGLRKDMWSGGAVRLLLRLLPAYGLDDFFRPNENYLPT